MLEITGDDVAKLNDKDLRELVVKLCEAELHAAGGRASAVTAGGRQTSPDGGVDVRVRSQVSDERLDFILRPCTGFQVKREDMSPSKIYAEMRPGGVLRPTIVELIKELGAYVIVCSQGTVADSFLKDRLTAMREAVSGQPGALDLTVDFYDRERLARWVRAYPGVEMWVRDRVDARLQGWQGHAAWSGEKSTAPLLQDDTPRVRDRGQGHAPQLLTLAAGIDAMRVRLSAPGNIVRLIGLSGAGKTRLAQALFDERAASAPHLDPSLVVYTDLCDPPSPSAGEMLRFLGARDRRTLVIIDNCNPQAHRDLARIVQSYPACLSLLTIEYDVVDKSIPEETDVFELLLASEQVTEGLLEQRYPGLEGPDKHRIATFCGGNARIALALARTIAQVGSLATLNDSEIFARLFRQNQPSDDGLMRVAEVCSLVYSFDGEDVEAESELAVLAGLACMATPDLFRHVHALQSRELVQARAEWRALLPAALANRLAATALEAVPHGFILKAFKRHGRLLRSFSHRLGYLHDSAAARKIVGGWLDDGDWLGDPARWDARAREILFNVSPVLPEKVLTLLQRAMAEDQLADFMKRQEGNLYQWISLLRDLAYDPAHFPASASLLLSMALHEDGATIDCRQAWKELFQIHYSGTMAPPTQRMAMIEDLLSDPRPSHRELAWEAIDAMLSIMHVTGIHDFSFGARPHGYGWEPSDTGEIRQWLADAFVLVRRIAESSPEGHAKARAVIAGHLRELCQCGVHEEISIMMRELSDPAGWSGGWFAVKSALRLDTLHMSAEALTVLRDLENLLSPKGLAQEVRTFVLGAADGRDVPSALDESDDAEDANPVPAPDRLCAKVHALGRSLAEDETALEGLLHDLLMVESGRQSFLGRGLADASRDLAHHWRMLRKAFEKAGDRSNIGLLAGFVQGSRNVDPVAAASMLEDVAQDPSLDRRYAAILGAPCDDADGQRLLEASDRPAMKVGGQQLGGADRARARLPNELLIQGRRTAMSFPVCGHASFLRLHHVHQASR